MRRSGRLPLDELQPYLLEIAGLEKPRGKPEPEAAPPPLEWADVFGNTHPVEIEVGFGKGLFLLNAGAARPDVNFLGIEIERKYQFLTATRLARRRLTNVRVLCADARRLLRDNVPAASVQAVHIYFPDPWWKKRHHKRRVFNEDFAAQCARILVPGGRLHLATDVEEYFQLSTAMLAAMPAFCVLPPPEVAEPQHELDYLTNFERKYRKEGRPVYRGVFERITTPLVSA